MYWGSFKYIDQYDQPNKSSSKFSYSGSGSGFFYSFLGSGFFSSFFSYFFLSSFLAGAADALPDPTLDCPLVISYDYGVGYIVD